MQTGSSVMSRAPRPSSLADVLDLILDKGLVIDAYVRISLAGIELLTVDARVVVASVDTYLRFAEAVNRLDLGQNEEQGLPELLGGRDKSTGEGRQANGSSRQTSGPSKRKERAESNGGGQRQASRDGDGHAQDRQRGSREVTSGGSDEPGVLERIAERARR